MNRRIMLILVLALSLPTSETVSSAAEDFVARSGQSGEFLELEHQINGQVFKSALPLHQAAGVRYFSAGVGLEERQAEYPPFSLKLVFTAGGKPYLAGVEVTIQPAKKGTTIHIPGEHVEGPWLFVDLPSGVYDVTATHGDHKQRLKGVKVEKGRQKTLHLRWAEDAGVTVKMPTE